MEQRDPVMRGAGGLASPAQSSAMDAPWGTPASHARVSSALGELPDGLVAHGRRGGGQLLHEARELHLHPERAQLRPVRVDAAEGLELERQGTS